VDAPEVFGFASYEASLTCGQTGEAFFYLFLPFLLSRKVRNAIIKPPKVKSKLNIPRKIEIISNAVIITHLLSYVFRHAGLLAQEDATLS